MEQPRWLQLKPSKKLSSRASPMRYLLNKKLNNNAGWSSLVARRAHNPKVVGSNPAPATISPEVSNLEASSFLVFLGFSKDVQNGCSLTTRLICTDTLIILGSRSVRAFSGRKIKFTKKIKLPNWTFFGLNG